MFPGIGPKTARRIIDEVTVSASLLSGLEAFHPPAGSTEIWPAFVDLIRHLATDLAGWPSEFEAVRRWYNPLLEVTHEDARARSADLEQLAQIAGSFPSREQFLTDLALDPPQASSDEAQAPNI